MGIRYVWENLAAMEAFVRGRELAERNAKSNARTLRDGARHAGAAAAFAEIAAVLRDSTIAAEKAQADG
jgi:hypothetical protein